MLFLSDLSAEPLNNGQRLYEVRVGGQLIYQVIGRFHHESHETLKSLLESAAQAIEDYRLALILNKPDMVPEQPEPLVNRTALVINNISERYNKGGLQYYSINRLIDDRSVNFLECIGEFEHIYEDGADTCLLKASACIDESLLNSDYVSIINKHAT